MATVFSCKITDVHKKGITAIGYHSIRREIIVGFEDGYLKFMDDEKGAILNTYKEHNGWINHIYHWKKQNLVFASGNDGLLVIIKNTGAVLKSIQFKRPIYTFSIDVNMNYFILNQMNVIEYHQIIITGANSLHLNKISRLNIHTDIVKCLTYYNLRFISGGYDGTLIIFEQTLLGKNGLIVNIKIQRAHTAGISALLGFIDEDKNNWLVTGSFDKYVKLWSFEGNLIHKFDGFPTPITGICYSIATRIIWVTFSNNSVHLFDPISGQNISHCVEKYMPENQKHAYPILLLHYCNEKGLIIGSTDRRQLLLWKFNPRACTNLIRINDNMESFVYKESVPKLIFIGDNMGNVIQLEKSATNNFNYILESIPTFTKKENVNCIYAIGKSHDSSNNMNKSKSVVLCMIYCFKENLLIGGTEYGDIYLWEYEKKFSEDIVFDYDSSARTYGNLDTIESEIGSELNEFTKSLTYSFVCKYIMKEHNMCINSLVLIEQDIIYLVSCCANNMICLWDITNKKFLYQFRINKSLELDGVGNLAYIYNLSHLAFSYTDCNICIFNFDNKNSQINVKYILDKHTDNINNILYNSIKETLVTSSEDGGIRIWDTNNNYCCIYFLQCELTAQIMCINLNTGSIVVAIDNIIKVFHHEEFYVTDAYTGHENTIKKLIHLKKEKKYLTMSNDKTIRFWNTLNSPN